MSNESPPPVTYTRGRVVILADDLRARCEALTDLQRLHVLAWLSGFNPDAVRRALDRCPQVDPDAWRDDYRGTIGSRCSDNAPGQDVAS
jgi:hypothetical protein